MEKILLTDNSVVARKESSLALGTGFRCGFYGVLHLEVSSRLRMAKFFRLRHSVCVCCLSCVLLEKKMPSSPQLMRLVQVFMQRLEQEHNLSVIATAPTVPYKVAIWCICMVGMLCCVVSCCAVSSCAVLCYVLRCAVAYA